MFNKSHNLIKFKFYFIVYSQNYIKVCKYTKSEAPAVATKSVKKYKIFE